MKAIPIALASHYTSSASKTLCTCIELHRDDGSSSGVTLGFTSLDRALVVDGVTYEPGFEPSAIVSSVGLAVDNLELTIIPDDTTVTEADLLAGLWDGAAFTVFECNYVSPTDGINILKRGTCGEVSANRGVYTVELRGLSQALQKSIGAVTSKTCRARFADYPSPVPGMLCRLASADYIETGAFTSVTNAQVMADSGRAEDDDYFGEGMLTVTSGAAAGYSQKVKTFAAGVFTLSLPLPFLPDVGDTYEVIAGCRKRRDEDCVAKFANVLNFQGEPDLPGIDALTKPPETSV